MDAQKVDLFIMTNAILDYIRELKTEVVLDSVQQTTLKANLHKD